jgi:hypothetical protein
VIDNVSSEVTESRYQLFLKKLTAKWWLWAFLMPYGALLLYHLFSMGVMSWMSVTGLAACAIVAFFAHTKHGKLPSLLIVIHMGLEWYHHALHGNHYGTGELVFYGVHALFDVIFLTLEAKEHYGKWAKWFLLTILVLLVGIFSLNYVPAPPVMSFAKSFAVPSGMEQVTSGHSHAHGGGPFHTAVLGGILGCLVFQMLTAFGWRHSHSHDKKAEH